jgi:hypothetical protein
MTAPQTAQPTAPRPPHLISALADLDEQATPPAEAPARRQPGQLVEVFVQGEDPYTVRITNRDRIAYEKAAARHKEWPSPTDGRSFAMTFLTWNAARRDGRTGLTFDQWQDALEEWDVVAAAPVDPTR